jgi:hypothetical protein
MTIVFKEKEAEDFLEKHHFPVVARTFVRGKKELRSVAVSLGFPIVLKNTSLLHKTDKGGVVTHVTLETLDKSYSSVGSRSVLVQKQIFGVEVIVGLKKDPVFGHVVLCGSGGIYTEMLKDVAFRVCPLTRKDAESLLSEIRLDKVLHGARGKAYARNALLTLIMKLSDLTASHPEVIELDMNPVIVDKKHAIIVDARIVFE